MQEREVSLAKTLEALERLGLTESERDRIRYQNARKLFAR